MFIFEEINYDVFNNKMRLKNSLKSYLRYQYETKIINISIDQPKP